MLEQIRKSISYSLKVLIRLLLIAPLLIMIVEVIKDLESIEELQFGFFMYFLVGIKRTIKYQSLFFPLLVFILLRQSFETIVNKLFVCFAGVLLLMNLFEVKVFALLPVNERTILFCIALLFSIIPFKFCSLENQADIYATR